MSVEPRTTAAIDAGSLLPGRVRGVLEPAPAGEARLRLPLAALDRAAALLVDNGARFVTLLVCERPERSLVAAFAFRGELVGLRCPLVGGAPAFASLSLSIPACRWPERELHDRFGVTAVGHPDLDPIVEPDPDRLASRVVGADVFALPYGPIRSGVFEAIQFLIATGGEDVSGLEVRPFFKHRDMEGRFAGVGLHHGALVAERVAGIASVAHAIAYAEAVERALEVRAPLRAGLWRAVYAELERIANHLDVAAKVAEDAALAVGNARFAILKEEILRLQARLTGSRFARGQVVPGGVRGNGRLPLDELRRELDAFERDYRRDRRLLLGTTSQTDRLIGTGTLDRATVESFAGVGPVARAAGVSTDARFERPYAAYDRLGFEVVTRDDGDAMARVEVRLGEIGESLHLLRQAIDRLGRADGDLAVALPLAAGAAFGWAEAPYGEVVHWVEVADGRVELARIADASLRNWPLFAASFDGDVLTDFSFNEHSFGLTMAGADR